jgi:hypothetical protein
VAYPDLTSKDAVIEFMQSSQSPAQWNERCDAVKQAHGGNYPPYWFHEIVLSGIAARTLEACGSDAAIHITRIS